MPVVLMVTSSAAEPGRHLEDLGVLSVPDPLGEGHHLGVLRKALAH